MLQLTRYGVDLKTGVARYQTEPERSVTVHILVRRLQKTHRSAARQILFDRKLISVLREQWVVVVGVGHYDGDLGGRRTCRCAVVRRHNAQREPIAVFAVQRLSQVQPAAVRKDSENLRRRRRRRSLFVLGESQKTICESRVVSCVQVDSRHLDDL